MCVHRRRYRRTIKVNLGDTSVHSRTSAPKIMLLLIESGVLYCLFWVRLSSAIITIYLLGGYAQNVDDSLHAE